MSERPWLVVLDTNVWVDATRLLRTPIARAFLHALRSMSARLLLPEVIERELVRRTTTLGAESAERVRENIRTMELLMGRNYTVPLNMDWGKAAPRRLAELEDLIVRAPFTEAHARGALDRVMDKRAPSRGKRQQFKDAAVFEAILTTNGASRVALVTKDTDFFESKAQTSGLAKELAEESASAGIELLAFREVAAFLDNARDELVAFDEAAFGRALESALERHVAEYAIGHNLLIGESVGLSVQAFLTEREGVVSVSFGQSYRASPSIDDGTYPEELRVRAEGQCLYQGGKVDQLVLERLIPLTLDGEELAGKSAWVQLPPITAGVAPPRMGVVQKVRVPLRDYFDPGE